MLAMVIKRQSDQAVYLSSNGGTTRLMRWGPVLVFLLALAFNLPYLTAGYYADDFLLGNALAANDPPVSPWTGGWISSDMPAFNNLWWKDSDFALSFWRPVPSLVMQGLVLLKYFTNEVVYDRDTSIFYHSGALGPYVRLTYSSPVLRDLVSVSTHLKVLYLSRLSDADDRLAEHDWGLGFGSNLSFWLYRNMSVDLGMTIEGTLTEPLSDVVRLHNRPLLQRRLRPQFGITIFF